jgi:hypothetical protein
VKKLCIILCTILAFAAIIASTSSVLSRTEIISKLSKLHIEGNKIVNENGSVVILRGLNYFDQAHCDRGNKMEADFIEMAKEWYAKAVRLPVHRPEFFQDPKRFMDRWLTPQINLCEHLGMYPIVDFHTRNKDDLPYIYDFWEIIIDEYANRTGLICDLANEPEGIDWKTWKNMAKNVTDLIRGKSPDTLIIVSGIDWGYDISYAIDDPVDRPNIVYGTHPYPIKFEWCGGLNATDEQKIQEWGKKFGKTSEVHCVWVTEYGWENSMNRIFGATTEKYADLLLNYLEERQIGDLAWNFSPTGFYDPALLKDWYYTPSYSGEVVKAHLRKHNAPRVFTCDETGNERDVFNLSESVYIAGRNLPIETVMSIYVIPNNVSANPSNAVVTSVIETNSSGGLSLTMIWTSSLTEGVFDIWVDVNSNGVVDDVDLYEDSFDIYDFSIVPEFSSWSLLFILLLPLTFAKAISKKKK